MFQKEARFLVFLSLDLFGCSLFRISSFGFRICNWRCRFSHPARKITPAALPSQPRGRSSDLVSWSRLWNPIARINNQRYRSLGPIFTDLQIIGEFHEGVADATRCGPIPLSAQGFTPEKCDTLTVLSEGRIAGDWVLGIRFADIEAPDDAWRFFPW